MRGGMVEEDLNDLWRHLRAKSTTILYGKKLKISWFQPKLFLYSQNLSLVYLILESWYQTGITYDNCVVNYICFFSSLLLMRQRNIFLRIIFLLILILYETFTLLFTKSVKSCLYSCFHRLYFQFYKAKHLYSTLHCLWPLSLHNHYQILPMWLQHEF